MKPGRRPDRGSQSGIALFMVISMLGLLSVLVAELTYSTQMNARMAYNSIDNLKAYYLAKAAFKLSLIRLRAYSQVKSFTADPANKQVKDSLGNGIADKIWSFPFIYPMPIPKEASMGETDAIKEFVKGSKLTGNYTALITSESSRLNLNNLLIKQATADTSASPGTPNAQPTPKPSASPQAVDFRSVLEPAISSLIEQKKIEDREFADVYRNFNGKDVVDAIAAYLFQDSPASNLPGFKPVKAKQAPLYSLSELHLVPGIDDELYKLLEGTLTVYSTPGINVNTMSKRTLQSLIPEMPDQEAEDVIRKRDDPEVGQQWNSEEEFWTAVSGTTAGRSLDAVKERFKKANLKVITDEQSFKISVLASVGLSTRRLEAYVIVDPKAGKKDKDKDKDKIQQPGSAENTQQGASAKKPTGLNLIYWRML